MAREAPTWGYDRIQGALANLGYKISDTTVGNILREHGIEPVRERRRRSTWKEFLAAQRFTRFEAVMPGPERQLQLQGWQRAVDAALAWARAPIVGEEITPA